MTDHWTGCNDDTYTTITFHYIKNWSLRNIIVDFKAFHGTTSGKAIYNDQVQVLAGYTTKCNLAIGITDTTGSMGVLGHHLHNNVMQHAYCTDHNLHCNSVLAFNGEHQASFCSDKNIPGANLAMSKARNIVEYFNKLTQQTSKLLNFQKESNLAIYSGHGFCAKKLLQESLQGGGCLIAC